MGINTLLQIYIKDTVFLYILTKDKPSGTDTKYMEMRNKKNGGKKTKTPKRNGYGA